MTPWNINIHPCKSLQNQPSPSHDGEARFYISRRRWENTFKTDEAIPASQINPPVLYVNGIQTAAETHKLACLALSWLFNRSVLGIHNKMEGWNGFQAANECQKCLNISSGAEFFKNHIDDHTNPAATIEFDLKQCASDWHLAVIPMWWTLLAYNARMKGRVLPARLRTMYVRNAIFAALSGNKATQTLVGILEHLHQVLGWQKINLIAHSQGCLISSIALAAFFAMRRQLGLSVPTIYVMALASPAPNWPSDDQLHVGKYRLTEDKIVPKLGASQPADYVKTLKDDGVIVQGWVEGHDVRYYMSEFYEKLSVVLPDLERGEEGGKSIWSYFRVQ